MKKPAKPAKRRLKGAEKEFVAYAERCHLGPAKSGLATFSREFARNMYDALLMRNCDPCADAADYLAWSRAIERVKSGVSLESLVKDLRSDLESNARVGSCRDANPLEAHLHGEYLRALAHVIDACDDLLAKGDAAAPNKTSPKARAR